MAQSEKPNTGVSAPAPPSELTVSDISADCVTLSWEPPAGDVQNYTVSCRGGEEVVQEIQTEETSVTIRDLKTGQQFHFRPSIRIQQMAPAPPSELTVSDINADCVTLSWEPPAGDIQNYTVSCQRGEEVVQEIQTEETSLTIRDLKPGQQYHFSVCAELKNGLKSEPTVTSADTAPAPPSELTVSDISTDCVTLSWEPPAADIRNYTVSCRRGEEVVQELQTEETSVTIRDLKPGPQYHFSVCAQLKNGLKSEPTATSAGTAPAPPSELTVSDISTDCVTLSWEPPAGDIQNYTLSCRRGEEVVQEIQTEETSVTIRDLKPGQQYHFSVCAQLKNGLKSECTATSAGTAPAPPSELTVSDISTDCVSLSWEPPAADIRNYTVSCRRGEEVVQEFQTEETSLTIRDLKPGQEFHFSVCAQLNNGLKSECAATSAGTAPAPPSELTVSDISTDCVTLSWEPPAGDIQNYTVSCQRGEEVVQEIQTEETSLTIRDLKPGQHYHFFVCAQLKNGLKSERTATSAGTGTHMESALERLGLQKNTKHKLSLERVLQIDHKAISETPSKSKKDVVWFFIKKLMLVNVTARNVTFTSLDDSCSENINDALDLKALVSRSISEDQLSLHDIITALFLCSDGFVQQELSLKMSMCQFAVPLLLPNCDTNQCTLMLWALRDIVKKYRPKSLSETKGFKEEAIVQSEIPMISFVRLGECSVSKSEILNKVLSNSQQCHDTFVHRDMEGGDCPRTISNGLAEITWYLPCGNKNIDIFDEPVAVANLRGDIASFDTQYAFLCHTSSAVFVFLDCLNSGKKPLMSTSGKAQMFLVANQQSKNFSLDDVTYVATKYNLINNNILLKTKAMNDANFVKNVQTKMRSVIKDTKTRMSLEQMASIAHELGICVDEDHPECQEARQNADAITAQIEDIPSYKEKQLPRQGETWKKLTSLEKEEIRLKNVGSQNIDVYKARLNCEKKRFRKKQNSYDDSEAMNSFIRSISGQSLERLYFLKWMRINLDNLSRKKLSGLREQYKEKSKESHNKKELKKIDVQLSNSSLGTEHFFREMGQIYEASLSHPEGDPSQFQHLPRLCAQLLLDGFPLELVDGDASNIPLRWVSDVLTQLHELVSPNNKILVVTVLGVQSTGKSTLLNTMFGVQFAVSSGRCTRGAFMLLIKISEDMKTSLNCDFLVIIDTEGLKSPELATLENSYEHDNELATLVVGLSNITIINIAMENSTEMKDILQIVVHAFLRMKEVGKKPKCQFVHQNVSDVSAHDKNLRDRKLLLEQLNEMTQAAAKMERKDKYKRFNDVMDYDPDTGNWYIPGLWNGNPPMAPVNAGYSEAVFELKKNVIQLLTKCDTTANSVLQFSEWITSLWTSVKHENFIFSFRNSIVADAFKTLCNAYSQWEWKFKKDMYTWSTEAETQIKNHGMGKDESDIKTLANSLKVEMQNNLSKIETTLLNNLKEYFKRKDGHVYLVERYRTDFENSAKNLRKQLETSVTNQINAAADIKRGMADVERIKKEHTKQIEKQVCDLIDNCRQRNARMTDYELDKEFDKMWGKIMSELKFTKQTPSDILTSVELCLRQNLQDKGSHANELFLKKSLKQCGLERYEHSAKKEKRGFFEFLFGLFRNEEIKKNTADRIIEKCDKHIEKKVVGQNNYHDTYIEEILHIIDDHLIDEDVSTEFEVSLKQHICANAARRFQKMHEDFLDRNDPHRCLMENKRIFCADFKAVFNEKDLCQKKARDFTKQCLTPAVEDYIKRFLGSDIVAEMKKFPEMKERMSFQRTVLGELLEKDNLTEYLEYTGNYESYVKDWIWKRILKQFPDSSHVSKFEEEHIDVCLRLIKDAIIKAQEKESKNIKECVENICTGFDNKLVIEQNALNSQLYLKIADKEMFTKWLTQIIDEMRQSVIEKLSKSSIEIKLKSLTMDPLNELYNALIGCGKQCPFCNVPCEAGSSVHTEHWASLHRPQAFHSWRYISSQKLVTNICSTDVNSNSTFRCHDTKDQDHPYKEYREIYPDWKIMPDSSYEASDYWKYVLAKYNNEFATACRSEPADIPPPWESITKEQALDSVQNMYCC